MSFSIMIAKQVSARSKIGQKQKSIFDEIDDNPMRITYNRITNAFGEKSSEVFEHVIETTMRKTYMEVVNATTGAINSVFTKPSAVEMGSDDSEKK